MSSMLMNFYGGALGSVSFIFSCFASSVVGGLTASKLQLYYVHRCFLESVHWVACRSYLRALQHILGEGFGCSHNLHPRRLDLWDSQHHPRQGDIREGFARAFMNQNCQTQAGNRD